MLDISAKEGDLVAYGLHFKALGPGHFAAAEGLEMKFDFRTGAPTRLTLTAADTAPQVLEKFQPIQLSAEDLSQYTGVYTSSELEATYRFAVKDGKLTLAINWQEPAILNPSVRDEFQGPDGVSIVFRRDAAGHITGCDLFAGRVRNIAFVKIAK